MFRPVRQVAAPGRSLPSLQLHVVGGCSEQVELGCVDEIIARCEARARSLLAGTIFDTS